MQDTLKELREYPIIKDMDISDLATKSKNEKEEP
jgi:hypothetical protein